MPIEITSELLATIKQKGEFALFPPPVVLALVAEVERLRAENETVTEIMHAQQKQLLMLYGIKPEDVQ